MNESYIADDGFNMVWNDAYKCYRPITPFTEESIEADIKKDYYLYPEVDGKSLLVPHSPENKFDDSLTYVIQMKNGWACFGKRTEIMKQLIGHYTYELMNTNHKAKQELISKGE